MNCVGLHITLDAIYRRYIIIPVHAGDYIQSYSYSNTSLEVGTYKSYVSTLLQM